MVGWLWKCVVVLVITEADSDDRFRSVYERNLTKLLEDTRSCVADFISLSTIDLTSRFSKELLAIACAKKTKWQNQADRRLLLLADAVSGTADGVVTKSQLEWLNAVRNCTDVANCLCTTGSCPADLAVDNNDSNSTLAQQKRQKRQRTHQVL